VRGGKSKQSLADRFPRSKAPVFRGIEAVGFRVSASLLLLHQEEDLVASVLK